MTNTNNIPLDLSNDLAYLITKARAICETVTTEYCEYAKVDPFSKVEAERENAYYICARYKIWSVLLNCAFDLLQEAETTAENLADKLDHLQFESNAKNNVNRDSKVS